MAKKINGFVKLQIPAGKATPAPPVGPALGQHGVNIMEFCKAFNAKTQKPDGTDHPGRDHGVLRPFVHVHHQDARLRRSCCRKAAGSRRAPASRTATRSARSPGAGRGDREDQDARPQRRRPRCRDPDDRRYRAQHGHRGCGRKGGGAWVSRKEYMAARDRIEARLYQLREAVDLIRDIHYAKFDETVEVAVRLGRRSPARGSDGAWHGGASPRHGQVEARARGRPAASKAKEAQEAGADFVLARTWSRRSKAAGWISMRWSRRRT